jgi:hypothetical protein
VNGVDVKRYGTMAQKADAYGNITTPGGTFPYLRIYAVQQIIDTFIMDGEVIGLSYSETYTYNYMGANTKAPIFAYTEVYTGQGSASSASYWVPAATGLAEQNNFTTNETVYPNPASFGKVNLSFDLNRTTEVTLNIFDMYGKKVLSAGTQNLPAGNHQLPIDVSTLPHGLYTIEMASEQAGAKAIRFVVD